MEISARFQSLLGHQLAQFADRPELSALVVYLALPLNDGKPGLIPVGRWPITTLALPALEEDPSLLKPSAERAWFPLRQESTLLGALRVETTQLPWSPTLTTRLQEVAHCLSEALRLDLEQQRLEHRLELQSQQLRLLVHQLRNPLAALRTFGQLLKRRLEGDATNRSLVEGLLAEERQLNQYVDAIDSLDQRPGIGPGAVAPMPLLLPPTLSSIEPQPLQERLEPLLQRAAATASLQGRGWSGPGQSPAWCGDSAAVAEILANLLENAFRYSPEGTPVGLRCRQDQGEPSSLQICVWDGGPPIAAAERQAIFEPGVRGSRSRDRPGSGLGLALARELARNLGGELRLIQPPAGFDPGLPGEGNAFCLELPPALPSA
ncbi:HAMP domain-containing histidine kinase [Synechococcus sp. CS-1325]|uniref:sensor histidine kinase n=1 Tax=unclassified Synechococcus TaxID=2626047 RepID=UPI000DB64137|nr:MULTISPECIES: HAMP domain-containing sensor histidine kinase [unclassified Synechococcus]MCT0200171.1 HAMP domain-containing histidine kinase [Synechococcus sp. CS-1325]MCT0212712.1 HAMP domain-containing histidine kinase [Synechococcus sp. CS-1326]MCT0233720.1 HAMP domain-containing histidine kinase [Synechococcus sp. CS-1327]PZV01289.1 MAG: two-component sensor histidine kinase [Cyanobium sp.]